MPEHAEREVWQKATDLLVPLFALTNKFPQDELQVRINQLRADAVGIVLNFAEGLGSENEVDFQKFVDSSLNAARNCLIELQAAHRLEFDGGDLLQQVTVQAEEIVRLLNGLKARQTSQA